MNYYISDLHFGCQNKYEGRTLEHDKIIIDNWNKVVTNSDTVYILGDIGRIGNNKDNEYLCKCISVLKGKKVCVLGNHEGGLKDYRLRQLFAEVCDSKEVTDSFDGHAYKLVLSHYPMLFWNGQHGNEKRLPTIHLYGHLHTSKEWKIYEQCLNNVNDYFLSLKDAGSKNNEYIKAINCGSMIWDYTPMTLKEMMNLYEYKKEHYFNELKYYYVYKHTNIENGKCYIGITSLEVNDRWRNNGAAYIRKNKDNKYCHPKFAPAILKYGWNNFIHEVIEEGYFTKEEIEEHEIYWIAYYDSYNNGYNATKGGGIELWTQTETGKITVSDAIKNLWQDEQYKRNNTTPVKCVENGYIFQSANEVSDLLGISSAGIRACCREKQETAGGYHWEKSNWQDYDGFYNYNPNYIENFIKEYTERKNEKDKLEEEAKLKNKPVLCIDKDIAYQGQVSASIITGIDRSGIGLCCLDKQSKCGGYKWKFISKDEYERYQKEGKSDVPIPLIRSNRSTPVLCVETNIVYNSMAEACKQTGIRHISECCRGLLETAGGYHWKIINTENEILSTTNTIV